MFPDVLRRLFTYNTWATGRVLDAAERLTSDQLHEPGQAGHGSVRDTLLHLLAVHHGWLQWWDGSLSPEEAYALRADPGDFPDVASLREFLVKIGQQTQPFLATLEGDDPGRIYAWELPDGKRWEMPLWGMLLHMVNHGTQHRAEVAAMLSALGHSPGDLDLIYYLARPLDAPPDEDAAGRQWTTERS
jgi:uncharacterized damage-inducible protein DinB